MEELTRLSAEESEAPETPEVPKEEASLATEVMHAVLKTSKGFRIYQPNNPLLQRFSEELNEKMTRHLELYGEYRLDVDQFMLTYKGIKVYENPEPKESLAFRLHSDGIRYLVFTEGLQPEELRDFLDIIGQDRPSDVDDDIVTLLWERDFSHLSYALAEDFLEYESLGSAVSSQQDKIEGVYSDLPAVMTGTPLLIPQKIFTVTEEEANWLRQARESDSQRKPIEGVIQILAAILSGLRDETMYREFVEILIRLTENMIIAGELGYGLSLIRFLHKLSMNPAVPPGHRAMISGSIGDILSPNTLRVLKETIDSTELIPLEELKGLLRIFGRDSLVAICDLLGQVEKMKARKAIIEVLIEIGRDDPEVFLPYLEDSRWYLVRNILFILTRIGRPVRLEPVVVHIAHKDHRVRREALGFLAGSSDPKARAYLLKFLRDPASDIRIRTLQLLARSGQPLALKAIAGIAAAEEFENYPLAEKKAVYEAMGELGGEVMVPQFRSLLTKRYWFNRAREKDTVICAVAGLVKTRSAAALPVLEEAKAVKGDEIRSIIVQGIEQLSAERANPGAGPGEG